MSRVQQAAIVLLGVDHATATSIVSRLPDAVVGQVGREIFSLNCGSLTPFEIERSIRAFMREIVDDSLSGAGWADSGDDSQALTTQECEALGKVLAKEETADATLILHRLPTAIATRILLSLRSSLRRSLIDSLRKLSPPPASIIDRALSRFITKIPPRPFPSLAQHFEEAVQAND